MFGPPIGKKFIIFIDDLNLPYIETYGTQNAIALLTQHMAYGTMFDRTDLGFRKELVDMHYITAMNPTAGSFNSCFTAKAMNLKAIGIEKDQTFFWKAVSCL